MRYFKLAFALTLLAAVLAFVAGNTEPVTVHFLLWQTPGVSLSLLAAVFFALGILFTLTLWLLFRLKQSGAKRKQKIPKESNSQQINSEKPKQTTPSSDETVIIGKDQESP